MNPALRYLFLFPKWWYVDRLQWWWQFITATDSLVDQRFSLRPRLAAWPTIKRHLQPESRSYLIAARLGGQSVAAIIVLGVIWIGLAICLGLWLVWPLAIAGGVVRGGWFILLGLLATAGALVLYWFGHVLQPKLTLESLDPAEISLATLAQSSTHPANQIYKTLPPAFSSAVVLKQLAIDPSIQRLFHRLDLSDPQTVSRLMAQAAKTSQVVSRQEFSRHIYNQAMGRQCQAVSTPDLLLSLTKTVPSLQRILAEAGFPYSEMLQAVQQMETEQHQRQAWKWWLAKPEHEVDEPVIASSPQRQGRLLTDATRLLQSENIPEAGCWQEQAQQALTLLAQHPQHLLLVTEPSLGQSTLPYAIAHQVARLPDASSVPFAKVVHLNLSLLTSATPVATTPLQRLDELLTDKALLYINDLHLLTRTDPAMVDVLNALHPHLQSDQVTIVGQTTPLGHRQLLASPLDWIIHFQHTNIPTPANLPSSLDAPILAIQQSYHVSLDDQLIGYALELADRYPSLQPTVEQASQFLDLAASIAKQTGRRAATIEDLLEAVHRQTGLPVEILARQPADMRRIFFEEASQRIVGQPEAVDSLVASLAASNHLAVRAAGIFVGPSGVGKTELAKILATTYLGSEEALIRIDAAEYQDTDPVVDLLGSLNEPDKPGQLTYALQRRPSSIIYLDNLEKASLQLLDILAELLNHGYLLDGAGQVISARQAIVIASTTVGARAIEQAINQGYQPQQIVPAVRHLLTQRLPVAPLLEAVDHIIVFRPLNQDDVVELVKRILQPICQQAGNQGIMVTIDEDIVRHLAAEGYNPTYGARPLRHLIQDKVESVILKKIRSGELKQGSVLELNPQTLSIA